MNKKEILYLVLAGAFVLLAIFLDTSVPGTMKTITSELQSESADVALITNGGLKMLFIAFCSLLAFAGSGYCMARFCSGYLKKIRGAVFDKALRFSAKEVGEFTTAGLIARSTQDVTQLQEFLKGGLLLMLQAPLTAVFIIGRIAGVHRYWTISAICATLAISGVFCFVIIRIMPAIARIQKINDGITNVNREHLSGIRVIRAFNAYNHQRKRLLEKSDELYDREVYYYRNYSVTNPAATMILNVLSVAIYLTGAYIISAESGAARMEYFSNMVVFLSYGTQLIAAFIMMVMALAILPRVLVSVRRIAEVINREPEIKDGPGAEGDGSGVVEFKNVSFRYPGAEKDAISNISFTAHAGETIAIIGATGSGKTTLLNLIPRMYDVTGGQVCVDGEDVRNYVLTDLRNRLGYVPQKGFLFIGTIAGNIGKGENGRFEATLDKIQEAARVGQADEFIRKKEGGYDAEVRRGGSNFSGGQRQRLTISRAVCRDPEIYLFDDSFSALDFKTDRVLRETLRKTASGATIFIVAQRISTIRNADQILVIDQGRLVGKGTHDELMKNCEIYKEIAISQIPEKKNA